MTKRILCLLSVTILLLTESTVRPAASEVRWKTLSMSDGVTLRYPSSWWPISVSAKRLNILSSRGGAEGVVIHDGQGEIIATISAKDPSLSFDDFVDGNLRDQAVLSREILLSPGRGRCSRLMKIVSLTEEGPNSFVANTGIFCEINNDRVIVLLRNWQGDSHQSHYQDVALRMAQSIRAKESG